MKCNSDFIMREIMNETILVPTGQAAIDTSGMVALNETGRLVYEMAGHGASCEEIAAELSRQYEVSMDVALKDVSSYVQEMISHRIII